SNHLVMPFRLRLLTSSTAATGDVRGFLLNARRISICVILALGFLYFLFSGSSSALASIGLISFAGVAQFLPSLLAALYWPRANALGASLGMIGGFMVWSAALFLPSVDPSWQIAPDGADPLITALIWSLGFNTLLLIVGSLARDTSIHERIQSARFVDAFSASESETERLIRRSATSADLFVLAQRILGEPKARAMFDAARVRQGLPEGLPRPDPSFISHLERRLASSVGAASARTLVSSVARAETISRDELMRMADETARLVDYSSRLEVKSSELEETAAQLREANERLRRLDARKDEFLSQVSHELRTPMTSLRAFAEILRDNDDLPLDQARRYITVMHGETLRLTRLLDEILDLNALENSETSLRMSTFDPNRELDGAIEVSMPLARDRRIRLIQNRDAQRLSVRADADRMRQVYLNVLSNAIKYNTSADPAIWVETQFEDGLFIVRIVDNGPGVPEADRPIIFDKFARARDAAAGGAGLGLAICRRIMERHGGSIDLEPSPPGSCGAAFRISIPALASKGPLKAQEKQGEAKLSQPQSSRRIDAV
ncbi:MAG: ATP-binding protein, partial [Pseudomonadota bacterium]